MSKQRSQPESENMKVTFTSIMCGPEGNAFPGTVMDIPKERMQKVQVGDDSIEMPLAEYLIEQKFARPYDANLDRKAKQIGLVKAER